MTDAKDPVGAAIAGDAPRALAAKAELRGARKFVLAVAAGVLIGLGGIAFLVVQAGPAPSGPVQLLSGIAFSVGLMMVMTTGAELFTGNVMFLLPAATGRLTPGQVAGSWSLVWLGNLVGSLAVAALFFAAGGLDGLDGGIAAAAGEVARTKLDKSAVAILASGILANMLVCLAVWMAMGARSLSGKAAALVGPVAIFVAAGLEHSIANMSLLPLGLFAGAEGGWMAIARNLILSTAGNILGGGAVALALGFGHSRHGD